MLSEGSCEGPHPAWPLNSSAGPSKTLRSPAVLLRANQVRLGHRGQAPMHSRVPFLLFISPHEHQGPSKLRPKQDTHSVLLLLLQRPHPCTRYTRSGPRKALQRDSGTKKGKVSSSLARTGLRCWQPG
ncbi:hypothetical protein SKAU_G00303440 [Synaphobranchus kaupii]|uniref:Uncharacterized protein n=1 Tax=Synaphobranchus kaupii TaxID=118154 RepID=A0A9Q1INI8_SYNKA|nr:hypothetical protein SKAU_G00303440 [Synaphobranchus kaupii]